MTETTFYMNMKNTNKNTESTYIIVQKTMALTLQGGIKVMWNMQWKITAVPTKFFTVGVTGNLSFTPKCPQASCQETCKLMKSPLFDGQLYIQPSFPAIRFIWAAFFPRGIQAVERAEVWLRGMKSKSIAFDCRLWSRKSTRHAHGSCKAKLEK